MKKLTVFSLAVLIILSVFTACSTEDGVNSPSSEAASSFFESSVTESIDSTSTAQTEPPRKQTKTQTKETSKATEKSSSSTTQKATRSTVNQKPQTSKPQATTVVKTTQPQTNKNDGKITVSISVDCKTAVKEGYDIAKEISDGGVILSSKSITVKEGSSVFDVLKSTGLIIGAQSTAMGTYVYSINSLAEKDCGNTSGWIYFVDGKYATTSCSKYILKGGEKISWRYTCNNGKDL